MRKPLHHHLLDYFFPHERNNYRPHLFSVVSVAVLMFAILIFETGYLVQTKIVFLKTDFLASVLPGVLIALTNQDRAAGGILGVTEDSLLGAAAQAKADDMAAHGYFSHVSPDGKTPWYWLNQAGYSYSYAGENLAVNFTDSKNVEMAWMESPTHRANIEKPQYTKVGIGVANGIYDGAETTFVVQFFATPAIAEVQETAPASVALEIPPATKQTSASASPVKVLGSQTEMAPLIDVLPIPASPGWLATLLASPLHTLTTILTILFTIIAVLFAVTVLVRGKSQHPTVLIGGMLLLIVISGAMLLSSELAGNVQLTSTTQTAIFR